MCAQAQEYNHNHVIKVIQYKNIQERKNQLTLKGKITKTVTVSNPMIFRGMLNVDAKILSTVEFVATWMGVVNLMR